MVREEIQGVEFIAVNTDAQALAITEAPVRFQLGEKVSRGLGVGGDHMLGQKAAEENKDEIKEFVSGADMVFITGGMGGGTGTGAAPIIAEIAKQGGALTIAVVTKPLSSPMTACLTCATRRPVLTRPSSWPMTCCGTAFRRLPR